MSRRVKDQQGAIIVNILIIMLFLSVIIMALIVAANANMTRAKSRVMLLQAQYAAESGADAAIGYLNADPTSSYTGAAETTILSNAQYKSTYTTTVADGSDSNEKIITSTGKVYKPANAASASFTRKIEVITQRTSDQVAANGMVSRNIIELASGVKNVYAKSLYVNGYIHMSKSTTNLIAENISVAGKIVSAQNCSIGGTGNLLKPASFSTAGQTKTNITVAYNNCINPPGNASNTDFNVLANQNTISKIQSTYIPWSLYMDSSYTNAGSCSDWTAGTSPHQIPSVSGSKKTHYPDSGSNISSSCGTNGDIDLGSGQYNINDNVHIRANLCAASACNPVFYNPTSSPRYIFVEGYVNFGSLNTAAGSGPIILITYGTDPSNLSSVCPYGGAMYLGNSSNTSAPNMYLLANNGVCLDKTKFGSNPALGGVSGKNIYVATNPGTPFDLSINTAFNSSYVPINLAWHAERYRRL